MVPYSLPNLRSAGWSNERSSRSASDSISMHLASSAAVGCGSLAPLLSAWLRLWKKWALAPAVSVKRARLVVRSRINTST